ncbi:MAG: hypothetical protein WEA99_04435 [Brumimicrobium sp.]
MRKLIFISILLIFHSTFEAFNQERDTLGLQKYFWNITPFIGLESETKNSLNQGTQLMTGGLLYKMGNNWRIKERKKSTIFFKLIWLRLGVFPQGLILTPLQVGTGLHHNFNKDHSFEVSMSGGLVISTDDAINPELEYNYLISPEVKINGSKTF